MDKRKEVAELRNALRLFVKANSKSMSDADALSVSSLHEKWAVGRVFEAGDVDKVVSHNGSLYRIVSAHTAQAHYAPGGEGLLALYRPVVIGHAGTLEDPIPYSYGMDVTGGLYYSYGGSVWIAKKNMAPCVWPPVSGNEWEQQ